MWPFKRKNLFEAVRVEVAKLELRPGDSVIIKVPFKIRPEQVDHIWKSVSEAMKDCRVIILDSGMSMEVLRHEEPTKREVRA